MHARQGCTKPDSPEYRAHVIKINQKLQGWLENSVTFEGEFRFYPAISHDFISITDESPGPLHHTSHQKKSTAHSKQALICGQCLSWIIVMSTAEQRLVSSFDDSPFSMSHS